MDSYTARLATLIERRVTEEIDRLKENLATGHAVDNHPEYKHLTGQIRAYRRVLNEFLSEAITDIDKQ